MKPLRPELSVAIDAVRTAASVCQAVQKRMVRPETIAKRDRSPVTVADFASQAVVCAKLAAAFPEDRVVGEESAAALAGEEHAAIRHTVVEQVSAGMGESVAEKQVLQWIDRGGYDPGTPGTPGGRYWTLDPIDGTKGFLRGEQYAVVLALLEEGRVVLGVLGCPNLPVSLNQPARQGVVVVAWRGGGAWLLPLGHPEMANAGPIGVSLVDQPALARFCESVEEGHSNQGASAQVARRLNISNPPVRLDSQAKYAEVARGSAEIYLRLPTSAEYRENIWDHAAGALAVEEAGGRVTDVQGEALNFSRGRTLADNRGIIATNGRIHDEVVEAVKDVLTL